MPRLSKNGQPTDARPHLQRDEGFFSMGTAIARNMLGAHHHHHHHDAKTAEVRCDDSP